MEVPKRKRIKDRVTLKEMRKPYCERCGDKAYGGVHHVISKGSGGPDHFSNLVQLCKNCHIFGAHTGHISKDELFEVIAKREGVTPEEVSSIAWGLKA